MWTLGAETAEGAARWPPLPILLSEHACPERFYQVPPEGQPPLPAVAHVRVTTPPSLLIVKVLPLLLPAVAVTV